MTARVDPPLLVYPEQLDDKPRLMPSHLPIMTTNELPKAKADDAAFWQRALILKWNLSLPAPSRQVS